MRRPSRTAVATSVALVATLAVREAPTPDPAPAVAIAADASDPVAPRYRRHEIRCLARAVWHEARGEPLAGRIAVARVVMARADDRRWPKDLCATIRARRQFSFVRNGRSPPIPKEDAQAATDLVRAVASGRLRSPFPHALYYHASSVRPVWRHGLDVLGTIGHHVFYADPASRTTTTASLRITTRA